jgi:glycerol-3-phosphate dehydrogenase subunit B
MSHDAVVIGTGLAGLTAAVRLAEEGAGVLVLAQGVGATHLAPPTIDVLGYADGEPVRSPREALPAFVEAHPEHPYARLSPDEIAASASWLSRSAPALGYVGGIDQNLLLPTAAGVAKPSALVPETMAGGDLRAGGRFLVVGLRGLKDFHAAYAADNLRHAALPGGAAVEARSIELVPPIGDASDAGSLGLARRFEDPDFRSAVTRQLAGRLEPGEAVGFPAVLGVHEAPQVWRELGRSLERPVFEVPTLPPSVSGMRLFEQLKRALRQAGGKLVVGSQVVTADAHSGRLEAVVVETAARRVAHRAASFVLASGGFASGALELDSRGVVREAIFGLPVAAVPPPGSPRFVPRYFDPQPLWRAGLAVDERLRPVDAEGGPVYENLHAAGAVLAGALPWREQSGNGIALATGYAAAAAVLEPSLAVGRVSWWSSSSSATHSTTA